ncbi:MAG: DUF2911 domain-containing protein [Flavobacteriaceae bacterium]|nr:DUF2911 domain-containing protein [Flavobacteriaceae bacterium]
MKTKILITFMLVSLIGYSQKSPEKQANGSINGTKITIDYSSPKVKERVIYGDLVPYGEVWRAGANKNTTIEFSNDVKVNGQELSAGKYGFFIIPNTNKGWELIFSKKADGWGSFSYSESKDALRIETKVQDNEKPQEELLYKVIDKGILFSWSDKTFTMRIQ